MKVSPVGHNSPLFCHIFGLNNALKAVADPPHFSPEIGATETSKKSPEAAETMASLMLTNFCRRGIERLTERLARVRRDRHRHRCHLSLGLGWSGTAKDFIGVLSDLVEGFCAKLHTSDSLLHGAWESSFP